MRCVVSCERRNKNKTIKLHHMRKEMMENTQEHKGRHTYRSDGEVQRIIEAGKDERRTHDTL